MNTQQAATSSKTRRVGKRIAAMTALVLVAAMIVPLSGYVYVAFAQDTAVAQTAPPADPWAAEINPRSEVWRDGRQATEGVSQVKAYGANVLMQSGGENFRQIRMGPVSTYLPWYLAFMFGAVVLFYMISGGGEKIEANSGKRVPRWGSLDIALHWFVAILFLALAITGLSLLFGRAVLIPLLGPEGFAAWAYASKNIHNYGGAFFTVGVLLMIIAWTRYNIPDMTDVKWLLKGGAFGKHLPAGRMNGGEKAWFWVNVGAGIAVCATGIMMINPQIFETRELFQWNLIIHTVVAILWLGASFGHMYMATLGAPGSMDAMTKGHVSSEWAKIHHDLWYDEVKDQEFDADGAPRSNPGQGASTSSA
ncbi:MAG: formate dehydrogenase subunit gamma [Wenzhouxiangella sp.]|jgi:formate dehydrogenase subunit gamma|nr:formate dehydrogenase subunit gamma [Wenzhouxiangella sp.]